MKTVIITGASGNLGTTVVHTFLEIGYKVIATVINEESKGALPVHSNLQSHVLNLQNEEETSAFIQSAIADTTIDAALLLAGGYAPGNIEQTTVEQIRSQIGLNFETAYNIARPLLQHMMEKGTGRIVFIGAQPPLMPQKGKTSLAYSLSKSLLFRLAEIINESAKGTDVVAAVVVPSTIDTPANRKAMPGADATKWVQPSELADVLAFICSDKSVALREPVFKVYKNTF